MEETLSPPPVSARLSSAASFMRLFLLLPPWSSPFSLSSLSTRITWFPSTPLPGPASPYFLLQGAPVVFPLCLQLCGNATDHRC